MEDQQDISLQQSFDRVKQIEQSLASLDPRSDFFRQSQQQVMHDLERCRSLISNLSIFSPNEELEDISTQNLQYLTVDYLLADLLLQSYGDSRIQSLQTSAHLFMSFLDRLDQYNVLSTADRKLYERYQEDKSEFSLLPTKNAEERRRLKIARFQEEIQLIRRLNVSIDDSIPG